jgi:hypothetical protein
MKILVVSHEKTDVDLFRMHCREGFDPELKWLHISDQGEIIQILSEKKFDVMCTNPVSPEGWKPRLYQSNCQAVSNTSANHLLWAEIRNQCNGKLKQSRLGLFYN